MEFEYLPSGVAGDLRWRYHKKHFFAFSERAKEALWVLAIFLLSTGTVAYLGSHFIVYLVAGK